MKNEKISVWLSHNDKVKRQFRCVNCGKIVFEYLGEVKSIVCGDNEVNTPVTVECKGRIEHRDYFGNIKNSNCHTKYIVS
jgi:hypothetical protein